jgi:predicted metal-dependent hydrolase
VFVRHPRARRYVVSVKEDGAVRVTLPCWGTMREARAFAGRLDGWIEKQRRRLERDRSTRAPEVLDRLRREARARATRELPPRLLELAAAHGLAVSKVSVRNQRWRWGSCSPSGHVCLNWRLVSMPPWVRDYVMIHELMHLRRMDHSRKFWKLVAQACPDYEAARRWLRQNGRTL